MVCNDKFVFKEFLYNRKTIPFMSLGKVVSMMEFFDDIPLNMRKYEHLISHV